MIATKPQPDRRAAAGHLARAWRTAWRPRPRPRRSDWSASKIRLPALTSATPGRYDLADRPYVVEILDTIDDPNYNEIVLVGGTQIGKTELVRAATLSQPAVDRAPAMLAGPDQPYAREQREIVYRTAEQMPALRDRIPPQRLRNDRYIDLGDCLVYLAWSGSGQRLSGRSCKLVLCSEVDRWVRSPELATQRTKAFFRSCVLYETAVIGESPYGWPLYLKSDRRAWWFPCATCGLWQMTRFFVHKTGEAAGRGGVLGLVNDQGRHVSPAVGRRNARYACLAGCEINPEETRTAIRRGRWIRHGCHADRKTGQEKGRPSYAGRRAGFHAPSLLSPNLTIADHAEKYLDTLDTEEGRRVFVNDWLALPHKPRGAIPRWRDLGNRLARTYPRGQVPRGAYFLTAAADVQANRVYFVVRAWGPGATSWLIDFGCLKRARNEDENAPLKTDLIQLPAAVLTPAWPVDGENPVGRSALRVRVLGVDCGYRRGDVYDFVRGQPGDRVLAIWGDPKISPGVLYRRARSERNVRTGQANPEGLTPWAIDTTAYKTDLVDRWTADPALPGAWHLPLGIVETDGGEDYLRQLVNERPKFERVKGRKRLSFELIDKETGNHYWDCEVYARALADMVVGQDWDAANWLEPVAPKRDQPDQVDDGPVDFSAR